MLGAIIDTVTAAWGSYHDRKAQLAGVAVTIVLGVALIVWLA